MRHRQSICKGLLVAGTALSVLCSACISGGGGGRAGGSTSSPPPNPPGSPYAWAQLGLGEPLVENTLLKGWSLPAQLHRIRGLKPKMFRLWFPADFLYDAAGNPSSANLPVFREAIDGLHSAGIPILGLQHSFPAWMTEADGSVAANWNTVPCPESAGQYARFLDRYETHWQRMATLFPEVAYWETANETNAEASLRPIQAGAGSCALAHFTHSARVRITLDLVERANRAIKSTKSKAVVLLPPAAPVNDELALAGPAGSVDVSLVSIARFLDDIYAEIAARGHSPRRYFDGVAWHPYIFQGPSLENWVAANEAVHQVIVARKDSGIPIVFSEVGNSEKNYDPQTGGLVDINAQLLASWMQDTIRLSQERLPWLSHLVWFRAFDDASAVAWGGEHQQRFGIMQDDHPQLSSKPSTDVFCKFSGCISEPFKAFTKNDGWKAYALSGQAYCRFTSDAQFRNQTGQELAAVMPWLPALHPSGYTFTGNCSNP